MPHVSVQAMALANAWQFTDEAMSQDCIKMGFSPSLLRKQAESAQEKGREYSKPSLA